MSLRIRNSSLSKEGLKIARTMKDMHNADYPLFSEADVEHKMFRETWNLDSSHPL